MSTIISPVVHPSVGAYPAPRRVLVDEHTPLAPMRPPPLVGQHTDEVLAELLGLNAEALVRVREDGTIGPDHGRSVTWVRTVTLSGGGFLRPVDLPRRMFVGGRLRLSTPLTISAEAVREGVFAPPTTRAVARAGWCSSGSATASVTTPAGQSTTIRIWSIGSLVLVFGFALYPRLDGGTKLLTSLGPVFGQNRV